MAGDKLGDSFPAGLRVMVVDDDPLCLRTVETMLKRCSYNVTTCSHAAQALAFLREENNFDLVLSDVYMPDMDGFKLLELIGLELDIPVIMMSGNADTSVVLRGITHGAEDYLLKPVRIEELRNLWQHVVRKRSKGHSQQNNDLTLNGSRKQTRDEDGDDDDSDEDTKPKLSGQNKKRKEDVTPDMKTKKAEYGDEDGDEESANMPKKPRVVWSVELHQQFVNAVNQLGIDKAVPKRILDLMSVSGLTRENVASHLQKYRLYLKRLNGAQGGPLGPTAGFPNVQDPNMTPAQGQAALMGFANAQTLSVSRLQGHGNFPTALPPQQPSMNGMISQIMQMQGVPENPPQQAFRQQLNFPTITLQQAQDGRAAGLNQGSPMALGNPGMGVHPNSDPTPATSSDNNLVLSIDLSRAQGLLQGSSMQSAMRFHPAQTSQGAFPGDDDLLNFFLKDSAR